MVFAFHQGPKGTPGMQGDDGGRGREVGVISIAAILNILKL